MHGNFLYPFCELEAFLDFHFSPESSTWGSSSKDYAARAEVSLERFL